MNQTPLRIVLPLAALTLLAAPVCAQQDDILVVEKRTDLSARNRLLAHLRKHIVTVNFDAVTMQDIASYLTDASGKTVNFLVSKRTLKLEDMPTVTLRLKSINLVSLMTLIEEQSGMKFTFASGVVFLKPKDEVKEFAYLRMYDVRAAVMPVTDFRPPKLGLRAPGEEESLSGGEGDDPKPIHGYDIDRLVDIVKAHAATESWDTNGISIDGLRGVLLVRQTVRGHAAVRKVLEQVGAVPRVRRVVRRAAPAKVTAPKSGRAPVKKGRKGRTDRH